MVNLGYDMFVSFDVLARSFDILSLSYGWWGMTPEFQINKHTFSTALWKTDFRYLSIFCGL